MHFVHTCIIIILAFSFFSEGLSQRKVVKVTENDIYDRLLEIYKGSEKFMDHIKDKFNKVTGQTEFRLLR